MCIVQFGGLAATNIESPLMERTKARPGHRIARGILDFQWKNLEVVAERQCSVFWQAETVLRHPESVVSWWAKLLQLRGNHCRTRMASLPNTLPKPRMQKFLKFELKELNATSLLHLLSWIFCHLSFLASIHMICDILQRPLQRETRKRSRAKSG